MTIRRGQIWGEAVTSPDGLLVLPSDSAVRAVVVSHRQQDTPVPPLGISGGDLARTMGGGDPHRFPGQVARVPLDVVRVDAGGQRTWAVAHVVARRRWWRGELFLAMNAQFLGEFDVAPRSHPNDAKVDVVHVDWKMGVRTRLAARRRARTGTHVPHPQISVHQTPGVTVRFRRPLMVWVDGERWMDATELTVTVEPDALIGYA